MAKQIVKGKKRETSKEEEKQKLLEIPFAECVSKVRVSRNYVGTLLEKLEKFGSSAHIILQKEYKPKLELAVRG